MREMAVWGGEEPTRQERRAKRKRNGRKMVVTGKSVLLLATLTGVAALAKRRKAGKS